MRMLRDQIGSSCALAALLLVACSRQPKQGPPGPPSSLPADPATSANPFARTYPFTTATITYAKKDGTLEELIQIKAGKKRSQTTKGLSASDTWSLTDGQAEYNVLPKERRVVVFRSDTGHLLEAYRALDPAAQERVRRSIAILGPDMPYYAEAVSSPIAPRTIEGLQASCYRLTSRFGLPPSERCYFRGINLETTGTNPIDDSRIDGAATRIVLDAPLDDALFTIPPDFVRETASTDEIMHGVYVQLVERMKQATFTLESLDRYASVPK
jgi:hypothetical protein